MKTIALATAAVALLGIAQAQEPLSIEKAGHGEQAILLLPGLASGPDVWDPLVAALDDQVTFHRVSFAGFAGHPPTEGEEFIRPRIDALTAYLDQLPDDVLVVGHSLGGTMALALALEDSEEIGGVVAVDAAPFTGQLLLGAPDADTAAPAAQAFAAQLASMGEGAYRGQLQMTAMSYTADEAARTRIVEAGMASDRATVARAMEELLTLDLRERLAELDLPITVLYATRVGGRFSPEQVRAAFEAQYAEGPEVTLVEVPESGHFIMDDQPAALIAAVRDAFPD